LACRVRNSGFASADLDPDPKEIFTDPQHCSRVPNNNKKIHRVIHSTAVFTPNTVKKTDSSVTFFPMYARIIIFEENVKKTKNGKIE
jgi:hypothetical protein